MLRSTLLVRACGAWLVVLVATGLASASTASIVVGQTDDFEDGSTNGWVGGTILSNVTGGPTGRYLKVQTDTSGEYHWGARNPYRWGGGMSGVYENYLTNSIKGISMDLNNFGPDPLWIRVMFVNGQEQWTSTNAYSLPANSGWQHVVFGITATDLTRVKGSGTWATTMSYVQKMHIYHDPGLPSGSGSAEHVNAIVGMDNVTALATPEPATMLLLAAGATWMIRQGRAKARRPSPHRF